MDSSSISLAFKNHLKRWLALTIILVVCIGVIAIVRFLSAPLIGTSLTTTHSQALPVASANQTAPLPWRLNIPSIGLDAAIQEVGLTKEGNMGVPSNYTDVGWLKTGPRPGQPGNAVLAGHLNAGMNKPAVFEKLHKLKPGDIISVKDKTKNEEQRFEVTGSQNYDVSDAPLEKIFGGTQETHLNLITCSGKWDKTKKDYNQRLVVFTDLVQA